MARLVLTAVLSIVVWEICENTLDMSGLRSIARSLQHDVSSVTSLRFLDHSAWMD